MPLLHCHYKHLSQLISTELLLFYTGVREQKTQVAWIVNSSFILPLYYQIKLWWRTFTEDQYEKPHKTWLLSYWLILKIPEITICFWSFYLRWWLGWCCFSWKKYFTFRRYTASWVKSLHSLDCRDTGKGMESSCTSRNDQLHPLCEGRSHSPFSALCRCCSQLMWSTAVSILGGSMWRAACLTRGSRTSGEVWDLLPKNWQVASSLAISTCNLYRPEPSCGVNNKWYWTDH